MSKKIVGVANDGNYNPNDEFCSICDDDTVVLVVNGGANCYYCGNQINLCSVCLIKMEMGIADLRKNNKIE